MALQVEVKADFGTLTAKLRALPGVTDAALRDAVNNTGYEVSKTAVNLIASHIGVSPNVVEEAITRRAASALSPTYIITADDAKFPMVRWITQRDEKVCKICGPRDGHLFTTMEVRYIFPAHPNCRCQLEKVSIAKEMSAVQEQVGADALKDVADRVIGAVVKGWGG